MKNPRALSERTLQTSGAVLSMILVLLNSLVNTKFFMNLPKRQKVDLRNVWKHDLLGFTLPVEESVS